ncbi:major facilitator superfamily MFS_1 [Rubrobacter xylanophilus DSM 9941]|uniref:Major facilitator superfamily MFS_1 n=1 Tax=Rubrobacter xylanophilus (strain DSM 9941 / JCM 11954 / NBRC 16129 / PRD-1) TaxID=266117 RepID=Q1AX54_RUBXD|nr:MFS transporter [Rubrobacter xylanophilus]ABG04024.1 major facilitator superfamily MFS_1 [Rubrobacter xylanophilus DSM 9941]
MNPPAPAAERQHRLLLAVVTAAVFVSVLNSSMVNVVVPVIARDFRASEAQIGWVITGFLLSYAVAIPLYGRVSDAFSLRKVFAVGLWVFAAGSFVCALAPSLPVLVLGRILQAAGGAAVPALGSVAVTRVLPPGERGGALGLIISSVGVGAAVGPIVGGLVEELAGWHLLFYGSLLLSLLLIPGALRVLPDGGQKTPRSFDLPGGILLGLCAGLFLFGITQGQTASFLAPSSWGSFLLSALAAGLFVWRINTAPHPFVSPKLFANRPYVAAVAVGFFSMFANVSTLVTVPLLVTEANGLSPGQAGLVLTPGAAALAALSPFTGRLSDRIGVKLPIRAGLSLMLASTLFLSTLGAGGPAPLVAAGMLGVGTGFAFANPPTNNAAANALPSKEVGAGLGIFNGAFFLGGGTGPAVIGALIAARSEGPALNPLHDNPAAAPFSDAFLAISAALLLALCASLALSNGTGASSRVD